MTDGAFRDQINFTGWIRRRLPSVFKSLCRHIRLLQTYTSESYLKRTNLLIFSWPINAYPSIHICRYSLSRALASIRRRLHSSLFSALLFHPKINSFSLQPGRRVVAKSVRGISEVSWTQVFSGMGSLPPSPTPPPTWRTRVSLFFWVITFDLSGLGDPASSYATAGLALRIIWPHKPHHCVKVGTPSGGSSGTALSFGSI